jgi:SAM-dependent methyltransferase
VLEVGVGAGTDFLQWVRAGAQAYGVDLTPEAVEHVRQRLAVYGLEAAEVRVADCENLPFENNTFDVVYSWGVLHHTPDTAKSVAEVVRVTRPGGVCKVMLYHRQSLTAFYLWVKWALLRGRPWRTVAWCFANRVESPGTKAFSRREVERMLEHLPVENVRIQPVLTHQDRLAKHNPLARLVGGLLAAGLGSRAGFYLTIELNKRASGDLNRHSLAVKGVAGQGA